MATKQIRAEVVETERAAPKVQPRRFHRQDTGAREAVFRLEDVSVSYGPKPAVREVSFDIGKNEITALIGPSGCGKSTLIRCLNRMNDLIPGAKVAGNVLYHGEDLYGAEVDAVEVRKRIGMAE